MNDNLQRMDSSIDYLVPKLKTLASRSELENSEYTELFRMSAQKQGFDSDESLLYELSRRIVAAVQQNRLTLGKHKKTALMTFVMCVNKVLQDRTWYGFNEDGNGKYSNFLRYCTAMKIKPKRLARYLYEILTFYNEDHA